MDDRPGLLLFLLFLVLIAFFSGWVLGGNSAYGEGADEGMQRYCLQMTGKKADKVSWDKGKKKITCKYLKEVNEALKVEKK